MTKLLQKIVLVAVLAGLGIYVYANYLSACSQTLSYSIGSVDPRFGITADQFAELAKNTETVWESPFNREFFQYDPNAKFKINLIFDERQQRTIDEKHSRTEITTKEGIYRGMVEDYESLLAEHKLQNSEYEANVDAYQQRLAKYNSDVDHWNKNGGAPSAEYNRLQREKSSLQAEARRLEAQRVNLNQTVQSLNALAQRINTEAKTLNLDVDAYNGKFGTSREFDQGNYTGKEINIYQFNTLQDLKLVLAHEYGHALGIDHIDDPHSIMYYLMDQQNIENLQLTQADISALRSSCGIR